MTITLVQIARTLNGRIVGDKVRCPGPGHSPDDNSLQVGIKDGGDDIFVHSFSPADDDMACLKWVRDKLGIKFESNGHSQPTTDQLADAMQAAVAAQQRRALKAQIVKTYDYTDEAGTLLYQAVRLEPKSFRQRQPDSNGGWIWNLNDVRRVPYRLPEIIAYTDAAVFVCEGEKDADNLAALDLCATTVASGTWADDCLMALAGRHVWILVDNDPAGEKKALEAATLLHHMAASVKLVRFPGLPPKGDVSDWLDMGHTKDELLDVCAAAPDWAPTEIATGTAPSVDVAPAPARADTSAPAINLVAAKPAPPLPFINIAAWDSEPVPQQEWTVHNRFPLRQAVLFSGEGAAGKSTIYLHLCGAHVLGKDWLNGLPELGPALFIEAEDGADVMHRRLAAVANHFGVTFGELAGAGLNLLSFAGRDAVIATATRSGKIEPTPLYKQFVEAAGDIKPKMIGIASSANVYAGSEIDRSQVQQFISLLTRLAMLANGTCHLISHPSLTGINTDTGLSGNTQWHNAVRARCYLKSAKPEAGEQPDNDLRELVFKKNNYGPVSETIVLRYQNGLFLPLPGIGSLDKIAQEAKADEVFIDLLGRFGREGRNVSYKPGPTYAPAIFTKEGEAKKAGMNSKALEAAMRRLFQAGKIWNEQYGRPARPNYRLALGAKRVT